MKIELGSSAAERMVSRLEKSLFDVENLADGRVMVMPSQIEMGSADGPVSCRLRKKKGKGQIQAISIRWAIVLNSGSPVTSVAEWLTAQATAKQSA